MRRSTRAKKATPAANASDHELDSAEDKEFVQPAPKKARAKRRKPVEDEDEMLPMKKTRRVRGILKELVEMPIDILYEIFGHLEPLDLVHISRTTKALRSVVMNRASITVWQAARANIEGLPDCPEDLTEPQYAVLAFEKACSFCNRRVQVIHTSWSARAKCCNKCLDEHFTQLRDSQEIWATRRPYPTALASWIPCMKFVRYVIRRGARVQQQHFYYLKSADAQWEIEFTQLTTPQSKSDWLKKRLEERYIIAKSVRRCNYWYKKYNNLFEDAQDMLLSDRFIEILEHVKTLGLENDLNKLPSMGNTHPLDDNIVQTACREPLTEEYLVALTPRLTARINERKEQASMLMYRHLLDFRQPLLAEILAQGIKSLPIDSVYPNIYELYTMAEKGDLIDYSKSPADALQVPFNDLVDQWRKDVESQLIGIIAKACGKDYKYDPSTVLSLATTFFVCSGDCTHRRPSFCMRYKRATMHFCANRIGWRDMGNGKDRTASSVFSRRLWNTNDIIQFDKEGWKALQTAVALAGLDPTTATAKDMDDLNPIFECLTCHSIDLGRATMAWATVPSHTRLSHMGESEPLNLQLLDGPDASKVRERIQEEQARAIHVGNCDVVCPHCRKILDTLVSYRKHLDEDFGTLRHQIKRVKDSELIFSLDQNRIAPLYRLWPPREPDDEDGTDVIMAN